MDPEYIEYMTRLDNIFKKFIKIEQISNSDEQLSLIPIELQTPFSDIYIKLKPNIAANLWLKYSNERNMLPESDLVSLENILEKCYNI